MLHSKIRLCWHTSVFGISYTHTLDSHIYTRLAHSLAQQRVREAFRFHYFSHTTFVPDVTRRIYYGIKNPIFILLKIGEPLHRLSDFRFPKKRGFNGVAKRSKVKRSKKKERKIKQSCNTYRWFLFSYNVSIIFSCPISFEKSSIARSAITYFQF